MLNLIGGGGHASVIADIAWRCRIPGIVLWVDADPDLKRFPPKTVWRALSKLDPELPVMLALGDLTTRMQMRARFQNYAEPVIDPSVIIGSGTSIGRGTVIMPACVVNPNAHVAEDCILNTGCIVEHDCRVGANTHLSPGVRLAGGVTIGAGTHIGTGAIVLPGVTVGDRSVVGAGAVVVRNVPADVTVVGVPARPLERSADRVAKRREL